MTLLDNSVVIDRIKAKEAVREDIAAVTFVEYPRIIFHKHFHEGIAFPASYKRKFYTRLIELSSNF